MCQKLRTCSSSVGRSELEQSAVSGRSEASSIKIPSCRCPLSFAGEMLLRKHQVLVLLGKQAHTGSLKTDVSHTCEGQLAVMDRNTHPAMMHSSRYSGVIEVHRATYCTDRQHMHDMHSSG